MTYRQDDPNTDPKPSPQLAGSKLARQRMIQRMGGDQPRMDWLELEARKAADRDARSPQHLALVKLTTRSDAQDTSSKAARERYLERIRSNNGTNKAA